MKLQHPMTVRELRKILEESGFIRGKKGSTTHIKYRYGEYVFTFTERDQGREVSPAQIKELKEILNKIKQDADTSKSNSSFKK